MRLDKEKTEDELICPSGSHTTSRPRIVSIFDVKASITRSASIGDAPLMQQQGMDNSPSIVPPWSKIQKRGSSVLELVVKLQCFFCSWRRRVNGVGPKPTIPFLKKKGFPFVSSH
jgi:hypothetical protein